MLILLHSLVHGLKKATVQSRLARNGPNTVDPPKDWPVWAKFIFAFFSGFAPLLWAACLLVFLSWEPFGTPPTNLYNLILAIVLIIVIVISSIFTFAQEQQATRILKGFQNLTPTNCVVIRDGAYKEILAANLVVGDTVVLQAGSRVPADIRVASSVGMKVDKSLLTGESEPLKVTSEVVPDTVPFLESSNIIFMGSSVVEGSGIGIVIASGADNQLAKIVLQASGELPTTSLQVEVNRLVLIIASFALVTGILVALWWVFYLRVQHAGFMTLSSMIANAISVVVAYVPEGLPLALSMGLTIIAKRLCSQYQVLVKRLGSIETLGSISLLASDKTGTLTQNLMTVTGLLSAADLEDVKSVDATAVSEEVLEMSQTIGCLCNQASFEKEGQGPASASAAAANNTTTAAAGAVKRSAKGGVVSEGDIELGGVRRDERGRLPVGSNSTDRAILSWVDSSVPVEVFQSIYSVRALLPFSSVSKVSAVVVTHNNTGDTFVYLKGASEYVLPKCSSFFNAEGRTEPISASFSKRMLARIDKEAANGRRMIALATLGPLPSDAFPAKYKFAAEPEPNFPMTGFTFVSCVGVNDPPREGVKAAVEELRAAGIQVAMVTGDAAPTAIAIARQVGIVTGHIVDSLSSMQSVGTSGVAATVASEAIVVTGKEIETITPEQWDFVFEHKELVFARTTPEQKLQIVSESQQRGHRVGVTGDGVNDSPALKQADVGIAMNSGSDVARDVAMIVLLNDDFTSIVHGVREGRLIFENLRKVIAYQISAGCWAELLPVLATFFIGMPQPLSSFLMIMISCLSDVYAGVALMNEPPEGAIMKKPPRDIRKNRLLDLNLVCYSYFFYANAISIGAFYNYFMYMASRGDTRAVPSPVPLDDDGGVTFPVGYRSSQLIFAWNWGLNSGNLGSDEIAAANVASSLFYITIVLGQMAHLLSIRRKTPYFYDAIMNTGQYSAVASGEGSESAAVRSGSHRNVLLRMWDELRASEIRWPIVAAWCGSILTINFFNYISIFQQYCGTGVVPGKFWGFAIGWSVLWFFVAELRKWIVILYPNSFIGRHAW